MTTITFDTHEFIKELKKTLDQAKHDYQLDDLAAKRDLKELELKVAKLLLNPKPN